MKKKKIPGNAALILLVLILAVLVLRGIKVTSGTYGYSSEDLLETVENDPNRETLIIGYDIDLAPYSYIEDGELVGFDVDIVTRAADEAGYNVTNVYDHWYKIKEKLDNYEIDAIGGMYRTDEREKEYYFTTSFCLAKGEVFSSLENTVDSVDELRNQHVIVQRDDAMYDLLRDLDLNIQLIEVDNPSEAISMVNSGDYDYAVILKDVGHRVISEKRYKNVISNDVGLPLMEYTIASKDERIAEVLSTGLHMIKSDGTYQILYDKWLGVYTRELFQHMVERYKLILLFFGMLILFMMTRLLVLKDVNKRKTSKLFRMHQDLLKNRVKTDALIRAIPDTLLAFSNDGVITECKTKGMKGLIGQSLSDLVEDDMKEVAYTLFYQAVEENKVTTLRFHYEHGGEMQVFEMRFSRCSEEEVLGLTRNITDEILQEQTIQYYMHHDNLTGLRNRHFLRDFYIEHNKNIALILVDVDGLKLINDTFGMHTGDKLLIKVASFLKTVVEERAFVARHAGDEFVVILENQPPEMVEDIVRQINMQAQNLKLDQVDISITLGWAIQEEESIGDMFKRAEDMLHKRKIYVGPSYRSKIIDTVMHTLHESNPREEAHSKRVSEYSYKLAKALKLSDKEAEVMKMAGLLHDIGKVTIQERIVNKIGKLTESEYEEMKKHPVKGCRILSSIDNMGDIALYIKHHHERYDGNGYPAGLEKEEIPFYSRIITVADSYDAMVSERPYKVSLTKDEAIKELRDNMGRQFDPHITEVFIKEVLSTSEEEVAYSLSTS